MHEVFSQIQEVFHICFVLELGIKLQKIARLRKTYAFGPGLSHAGTLRPAGAERQGGGLRGQIEHARNFRALSTLMRHITPLWSYQSIGSIRIKVQDGSFSLKQRKTKKPSPTQTWKPSPVWLVQVQKELPACWSMHRGVKGLTGSPIQAWAGE